MAKQVPHVFNKYELDLEERKVAITSISEISAMLFQTMVAEALEEKVELAVDTNNIYEFVQREAYLNGRAQVLLEILSMRAEVFNGSNSSSNNSSGYDS